MIKVSLCFFLRMQARLCLHLSIDYDSSKIGYSRTFNATLGSLTSYGLNRFSAFHFRDNEVRGYFNDSLNRAFLLFNTRGSI